MESVFKRKVMTQGVLLALVQISAAYAEEAVTVPEAAVQVESPAEKAVEEVKNDAPLNLDKIVVTGTAKKVTKMKSSVSITTLNATQVSNTGATNAAEIIRSIPGIRSESSGGEGNANMTVRGLPISAGGSRYLQMQEDGLPLLQFGDIAFATPDMFMRADQGLGSLEVIRGGSASTAATNSPGGIINFINQTGETKGGKVGLTTGLNYNQYRTDFSYGGPIDDKGLRGFVSGYYRTGEGYRDSGERLEEGGQIKGNLTKDLDKGYIRVSFKHLDDQVPANMPVPITTSASGNISTIPGFNPRRVSMYGSYWPRDITLTGSNGTKSSNVNDGLSVKTDSIGAEFSYDFADGWNFNNKFRYADNRGQFIGIFPSSAYNSATNSFTAVVFNTTLNDLGLTVNDTKVSKTFETEGAGKWTPNAGLYMSKQKLDLTWSFNQYTVTGKTATLTNYSIDQWGNCCTRDIDVDYTTISPYAALAWEIGGLNADVSVRKDNQSAKGNYATASDTGGLGSYVTRNRVNYDIDETSYSGGANYRINPNLAVFGRYSEGYAFNADRIMFGTTNLNGGVIPVNNVKQYETGVKWREGNLNTFITLFKAKTDESNYDATTQISTANVYDAKGVEVELGYTLGEFRFGGGLTYTDAEVTKSPGNPGLVGKAPNRQADWVYQVNASYVLNKLTVGTNVVGTSDSVDNRNTTTGEGVKMPGFAVTNAYLRYQYDKNLQLSLSANNLFDVIGYTEAQTNVARSVDGRTVRAGVIYAF